MFGFLTRKKQPSRSDKQFMTTNELMQRTLAGVARTPPRRLQDPGKNAPVKPLDPRAKSDRVVAAMANLATYSEE